MGFFHFLGSVEHAAGRVVHGDANPGGGVFGFLDKQLLPQSEQDKQNRNIGAKVVNRVEQTPVGKVDKGIIGAVKGTAQGIAKIPETASRSYIQAINTGLNKLAPSTATNPNQDTNITDPFRKSLYGTDKLQTYQTRGQGVHQAHPSIPAPLAVAGLAGLDLTPFGKGKTLSEQLIKASDVSAVKKLVPGIEDAKAQAIASQKDPHIIENILNGKNQVPAPPPLIQDIATPDRVLNHEVGQGITHGEVIPPPSANPFSDIQDALNGKPAATGQAPIKGLRSTQAQQATSLSQQRGARFGASQAAGAAQEGSAGYYQELHALKGEYNKPKLGGLIENIGPGRAEDLFSSARKQVQAVPDSTYHALGLHPAGARLNTQTALRKVIFGEGGGVPTRSEIKLLDTVSPELAADVASKIPKSRKLFDYAAQLAGLPRALKATLDLSMGGRQGILVAARHPQIWAKANVESAKMFKSADYYHNEMAGLRARPSYDLGEKYGLKLPGTEGAHEEAYASSDLAEKIPIAKHAVLASSRAYDGGLARMRMDLWDHLLSQYGGVDQATQRLGDKGMQDMAEVVNTMTGRGGKKGGAVETHMKSLSTTLFSPRLWASRLNTLNPQYYARLSPEARKEALQAAGSFAAVAGAALTSLAAAGAEVNTDPRNADFLKVKFGDTRYDVLGGFQQNLVFAWRELSGEKVNSQTGAVNKFAKGIPDIFKSEHETPNTGFGSTSRLGVASDVVGNKLNPILSSGLKLTEGKDKSGQPVNPLTEIGGLFVPLNLQGAYETIKHTNDGSLNAKNIAEGFTKNLPNTVGVGTQSYGVQDIAPTQKQQSSLEIAKSKGTSPDQLKATKSFFQFLKVASGKQTNADDFINQALAKGDVNRAQQIANDYNQQVIKGLKPWAKGNAQYLNEDLAKQLKSQLINLDDAGVKSRLKTILENPKRYNVKLGG